MRRALQNQLLENFIVTIVRGQSNQELEVKNRSMAGKMINPYAIVTPKYKTSSPLSSLDSNGRNRQRLFHGQRGTVPCRDTDPFCHRLCYNDLQICTLNTHLFSQTKGIILLLHLMLKHASFRVVKSCFILVFSLSSSHSLRL